jgi:large subunit ribosomal protein L4
MKTKMYNVLGKEVGDVELADNIFNVIVKPEVVHEVFVAQMNNQREPWADTKKRGEVRGGGKKPWQQKGTGRARHGSIRSPIWKGGGVTFGPLSERSYKSKINKKTRRLATAMCLSDKAHNQGLLVVDEFAFSAAKTKEFADFLKKIPLKQKTFVVLTGKKDDQVMRMTQNIPGVVTRVATDVNVMDLVNNQAVILSKAGVEEVTRILALS